MTRNELIAEIEKAKAEAKARLDRNMGAGSYDRIAAYSRSDANRQALNHIADTVKS